MAKQVFKDARLWAGGYNLSGDANALELAIDQQLVDALDLESAAMERVAGLIDTSFGHSAAYEAGDGSIDEALATQFGSEAVPMTICPIVGAAEGSVVYMLTSAMGELTRGGNLGDLFAINWRGSAQVKPVRGTLMKRGTISSTGNGTAFQVGAVAADEYLYAVAHVVGDPAGSSPTLDLDVESDSVEGFTGATVQTSFTQFTARGSEWITRVAGPITDDWWRIAWTLGGTGGPSFDVVVAIGIGS